MVLQKQDGAKLDRLENKINTLLRQSNNKNGVYYNPLKEGGETFWTYNTAFPSTKKN